MSVFEDLEAVRLASRTTREVPIHIHYGWEFRNLYEAELPDTTSFPTKRQVTVLKDAVIDPVRCCGSYLKHPFLRAGLLAQVTESLASAVLRFDF